MEILKKTDQWFEKRDEKFGKFSPAEHLKVSKLELLWDPFVQSRKGMNLKLRDRRQKTFEFLSRLCLLRGGERGSRKIC